MSVNLLASGVANKSGALMELIVKHESEVTYEEGFWIFMVTY